MISILSLSCNTTAIQKEQGINNLTDLEVIAKLGEPTNETVMALTRGKPLLEYQSDLYNISSRLQEGDTLRVKEMYWEQRKINRVVWLKKDNENKWISFDNLSWTKDIEF